MNEVFELFNRPPLPPRPMPKIKRKVPFNMQVITELNEVWGYVIENKQPRYYFLYTFAYLTNDGEKMPPIQDGNAVNKSIKRHKQKHG